MFEFISEYFNRLINRRVTYKCMAYIDDKKGEDKLVEALEIEEFSIRRAHNVVYEVLKLKYPDNGIDIRIIIK